MNKTLTALLIGLAGCTSAGRVQMESPKGPQKLTHQQVLDLDRHYTEMRADKKLVRQEMLDTIATYDAIKDAQLAAGVGDYVKDDLEHVQKQYKDGVEDVFNHLDIYLVLTGVDTAEFQNVPANMGASKPLYVGTGDKVKENFTFEQKEKMVRGALTAWKPFKITPGSVQEGGGRIMGLEDMATEISKEVAGKFVGRGISADKPGYKNLSAARWAELTDGKKENGEMSHYFTLAVMPESYAVD